MSDREIDQQLVERAQRGDKRAFDLLVTKYQRKLGRLLSRFIRDPADREVLDVVTVGDTLGHPFAVAPGVPGERVAALRKAFAEMLSDPDFRKEAAANNLEIDPVSAEVLSGAVNRALGASSASKQRARKYFQ